MEMISHTLAILPFQPWQIQVCIRPGHIQPEPGLLPELIPVSSACSDKEYLYSPLNWMLVYNRVIAALNLLVPISYSGVERGTVRVISLARFKTAPLDIGIYHTNHSATMPTRWFNTMLPRKLKNSTFTLPVNNWRVQQPCEKITNGTETDQYQNLPAIGRIK